MSVIDLLSRVETICRKYDKYDIEKQRELNTFGEDVFARHYAHVEDEIQELRLKAEKSAMESNRAVAVASNVEIRRTKARLMEELPKLSKLAKKKVKGLSKEEQETRIELVFLLPERIQEIPDGSETAATKAGIWAPSASNKNIKFDSSDGNFESEYFQQSEESKQFRQEYEMRKKRQDEGLDVISDGLGTLKILAQDMNEEMNRQVPLMDEIDTKVDQVTTDLKSNNVRLKENLYKMRSSRNFCIDIFLLCIILGIALYLYNLLR